MRKIEALLTEVKAKRVDDFVTTDGDVKLEDVKKAVRFYVRKQLKQGIKEKKLRGLNKDSCGKIEEKVAAKVVEGSTSLGVPGDSAEAFLSKQRREKVKKMVESYAASYAKAKK